MAVNYLGARGLLLSHWSRCAPLSATLVRLMGTDLPVGFFLSFPLLPPAPFFLGGEAFSVPQEESALLKESLQPTSANSLKGFFVKGGWRRRTGCFPYSEPFLVSLVPEQNRLCAQDVCFLSSRPPEILKRNGSLPFCFFRHPLLPLLPSQIRTRLSLSQIGAKARF